MARDGDLRSLPDFTSTATRSLPNSRTKSTSTRSLSVLSKYLTGSPHFLMPSATAFSTAAPML